ncbi:hypothetical protein HanPSC8_Chr04g0172511 [Helianthus annuus]|nr:hypothetical protein HanPSC8_Chr04g0172511 [Helianthus annuus]
MEHLLPISSYFLSHPHDELTQNPKLTQIVSSTSYHWPRDQNVRKKRDVYQSISKTYLKKINIQTFVLYK